MTTEKFSDSLLRQNELISKGWSVLRFTFRQVLYNKEQCRELLKNTIDPPEKYADNTGFIHSGTGVCPECGGAVHRFRNNTTEPGKLFWRVLLKE